MKAITAPINRESKRRVIRESKRRVIANLQGTLQLCLDRDAILAMTQTRSDGSLRSLSRNAKGKVIAGNPGRALSIFQRERNDATVILPDHPHVLQTSPVGDCDYPTRWMLMKTGFSQQIPKDERRSESRHARGEQGIWRQHYLEQCIRDDRDFARRGDCIRYNPVRHGYMEQVTDLALFDISSRSGMRRISGGFGRVGRNAN